MGSRNRLLYLKAFWVEQGEWMEKMQFRGGPSMKTQSSRFFSFVLALAALVPVSASRAADQTERRTLVSAYTQFLDAWKQDWAGKEYRALKRWGDKYLAPDFTARQGGQDPEDRQDFEDRWRDDLTQGRTSSFDESLTVDKISLQDDTAEVSLGFNHGLVTHDPLLTHDPSNRQYAINISGVIQDSWIKTSQGWKLKRRVVENQGGSQQAYSLPLHRATHPSEVPSTPDTTRIRGVEDHWAGAWSSGDREFFDHLLNEDFILVDEDGYTRSKDEWLRNLKARNNSFEKPKIDRVRVYGDTAVVTGSQAGKGDHKTIRYTRIYSLFNGDWQAVFQENATLLQ
jgi:hypothetical protein